MHMYSIDCIHTHELNSTNVNIHVICVANCKMAILFQKY